MWQTVVFILRQVIELPVTYLLLFLDLAIPELRDFITEATMIKQFDPAKDIGSLEGKVILVTGGMTRPPKNQFPCG